MDTEIKHMPCSFTIDLMVQSVADSSYHAYQIRLSYRHDVFFRPIIVVEGDYRKMLALSSFVYVEYCSVLSHCSLYCDQMCYEI